MQNIKVGEPNECWSIDLTGPHVTSRSGYRYIFTAIDCFTRYVVAVPLKNQEALTVARAFFDHVILRFGCPLQVLSDNGRNVAGNLFVELCKMLEIDKLRTTAYRGQSNPFIECWHKSLNAMMAKCLHDSHRDWPDQLTLITSAYNASKHDVTLYSPNYLTYGHELNTPVDIVYGTPTSKKFDSPSDYASNLHDRLESAYAAVRRHCGSAAERRRNKYFRSVRDPKFEIGDRVWLYLPRRPQSRYFKWESLYTGPFVITRRTGAVNFRIRQRARTSGPRRQIEKMSRLGRRMRDGDPDG